MPRILEPFYKPAGRESITSVPFDEEVRHICLDDASRCSFEGFEENASTTPKLASPMPKEPMFLYIAATNRVVSAIVVVEREEEGQTVQQLVYYLSEVLST
jgi:hypothetical protein